LGKRGLDSGGADGGSVAREQIRIEWEARRKTTGLHEFVGLHGNGVVEVDGAPLQETLW